MKAKLFLTIIFLLQQMFPGSKNIIAQDINKPVNNPPNIIIIMSDDHANNAISSYGSRINTTPNIDRIANEGMLFRNSFVTNSICSPSRAVMLTGKYSHINGVKGNRDIFDGNQMTFPKLLQQAGYQTALIGKWHLKSNPTGFDYWKIVPGQGIYYNPKFIEMGDTLKYNGYVTDLITDFAIQTLDRFDRNKPFCLLYFHKAPHRNWMPDKKHLSMYDDTDIPMPDTFFDDYKTRSDAAKKQDMKVENLYNSLDMKIKPLEGEEEYSGGKKSFNAKKAWENIYNSFTDEQREAWDEEYEPKNKVFRDAALSGKDLAQWKYQRYIKDYLRCVASLDDNIGRLLDYVDEKGLSDNTVIIYTSDQGFFLGEHGWYDKRFMYEESLSMPLIISYPKVIKAGSTSDEMVLNLDICPTILDLAGVTIPADVQGKSLMPILNGELPSDWRQAIYYHYSQKAGWHNVYKHYGIRTRRYKLIHYYDDIDAEELYDLESDPHELNNVFGIKKYLQIQQDLENKLSQLKKQFLDFEQNENIN